MNAASADKPVRHPETAGCTANGSRRGSRPNGAPAARRVAAFEAVFDLRARKLVQHHLHHGELVQVGVEQAGDDHGRCSPCKSPRTLGTRCVRPQNGSAKVYPRQPTWRAGQPVLPPTLSLVYPALGQRALQLRLALSNQLAALFDADQGGNQRPSAGHDQRRRCAMRRAPATGRRVSRSTYMDKMPCRCRHRLALRKQAHFVTHAGATEPRPECQPPPSAERPAAKVIALGSITSRSCRPHGCRARPGQSNGRSRRCRTSCQ